MQQLYLTLLELAGRPLAAVWIMNGTMSSTCVASLLGLELNYVSLDSILTG